MDTTLSQKLADLRKQNHLSQEALAEKLSLSRQAISKWERGESLPDTENLIALADIYGISLDELLGKAQTETAQPAESEIAAVPEGGESAADGVIIEEGKKRGQKKPKKQKPKKIKEPMLYPEIHSLLLKIPVFIIVPILYLVSGFVFNLWHPSWLIFWLIPIYYFICWAFGARSKKSFYLRQPVFFVTLLVFLAFGFFFSMWKTAWIVFLFNPIYYWFSSVFNKGK